MYCTNLDGSLLNRDYPGFWRVARLTYLERERYILYDVVHPGRSEAVDNQQTPSRSRRHRKSGGLRRRLISFISQYRLTEKNCEFAGHSRSYPQQSIESDSTKITLGPTPSSGKYVSGGIRCTDVHWRWAVGHWRPTPTTSTQLIFSRHSDWHHFRLNADRRIARYFVAHSQQSIK